MLERPFGWGNRWVCARIFPHVESARKQLHGSQRSTESAMTDKLIAGISPCSCLHLDSDLAAPTEYVRSKGQRAVVVEACSEAAA